MSKRTFAALVISLMFALAGGCTFTIDPENERVQNMSEPALVESGYAPVNGLEMYYEIHGEGEPLVLLHGAYMTTDLNFGQMLPALAENRQVIAIEQQGHGHTGDVDRPLTYPQMADDTAALLRHLEIDQADVLGYSMGGNIALELAVRHPDLVRKLVVISAAYNREGWYPDMYESIEHITPEMFTGSGLPETYAEVAPDPDGWPILVEKLKTLDLEFIGNTAEEIQAITAPMLIMIGDSDSVRPDSALELFKLLGGGVNGDLTGLPNAQLAVIPGSTHISVLLQHSAWLLPMIEEFLGAPMLASE
jgi:pimeloyl-ACP methyl ester carboxylesterase